MRKRIKGNLMKGGEEAFGELLLELHVLAPAIQEHLEVILPHTHKGVLGMAANAAESVGVAEPVPHEPTEVVFVRPLVLGEVVAG